MRTVTLAKGGTGEKTVNVESIVIPDLWHIAQGLKGEGYPESCEKVLETWHLAHLFNEPSVYETIAVHRATDFARVRVSERMG